MPTASTNNKFVYIYTYRDICIQDNTIMLIALSEFVEN